MKAVVFHEHGDLNVLKYEDVEKPAPGNKEILVRVKACSLNHLDIWTRQGMPGSKIPLPHILGCDIAGEVAELGHGAKGNFKIGDRVIIAPGQSCGHCPACDEGKSSFCSHFKIMGFQVDGGYAEYAKAPVEHVIPVSKKYSYEEWAAAPLVFLTAWHMLMTRAQLKAGESVLIHAAGSGIGSAAIQIAKLTGASVYTTAGSDEKLKKAKKLGADVLINYKNADFSKEIMNATGGEGIDVVFEHIGPETWPKSLASLKRGGRLVTCGATSGGDVAIDLRPLFVKHLSVIGSYMGGRYELNTVLKLLETGKLKPVLDSSFPLKEAAAAQKKMLERKQFGKIVLVP